MIPRNKVSIVSAALVRLGEAPIASLDETRTAVRQANALYDGIRMNMLAYPWRFALREEQLTPLADETPPNIDTLYAHGYTMPADVILTWGLASRVPFGVYGSQIWCDDNDAWLIYVKDVDNLMPSYFAMALEMALTAALAIPITESSTKAQHFDRLAALEMRKARAVDAQSAWSLSVPLHELVLRWPTVR